MGQACGRPMFFYTHARPGGMPEIQRQTKSANPWCETELALFMWKGNK